MKKGYILGISCGYHDSAAALIDSSTGRVLGACEEERFTGIKHDSAFPTNTIDWLFSLMALELLLGVFILMILLSQTQKFN